MGHWLDRLMRRESWVAGAVRRGLDAFAMESAGMKSRRRETEATPSEPVPHDAGVEAYPSIP